MLDPGNKDSNDLPLTIRAVFIIGPDKKLKLSLNYPASVGRNMDEIVRCVDALQLSAKHSVVRLPCVPCVLKYVYLSTQSSYSSAVISSAAVACHESLNTLHCITMAMSHPCVCLGTCLQYIHVYWALCVQANVPQKYSCDWTCPYLPACQRSIAVLSLCHNWCLVSK